MSGTSLDGLDMALCNFQKQENQNWRYEILEAVCINYPDEWKKKLQNAPKLSGLDLMFLHNDFGDFVADKVLDFCSKPGISPDFIASHGHTVFHEPEKGMTLQIGNGANISAKTKLPVVCDFRSLDVAAGGQGAPLVPIGDELLFKDYDFCLNLGGISNVSFHNINSSKRLAFDISPCNLLLNKLANQLDLDYDKNGEIASSGKISQELINSLDAWDYYQKSYPKSLDKEKLLAELLPIINASQNAIEDKLATVTVHIAEKIAEEINKIIPSLNKKENDKPKVLVTGGGAFNSFLICQMKQQSKAEFIVPDANLINYKEALIFAFLGLLRILNKPNCLASVTGADYDAVGGALYGDFSELYMF